jgi:hypothetical protein
MTSFRRTALKTATSGGIIATALIAFTGFPAQATILPSCDGVTSIPATEAALIAALAGTDPVICIEPGRIDLSSGGVDSTPGPIEITRSVVIIGADGVILDGGGDSEILTIPNGVEALNVTVQNLAFENGFTTFRAHASAIRMDRPGTLTILDSTFTGNNGYGTTVLTFNPIGGGAQPHVVVNSSTFTSNGNGSTAFYGGGVTGYGDVTITNSAFVDNAGGVLGAVAGSGAMTVQGNLFDDNYAGENGAALTALEGSGAIDISNNTFHRNTSGYTGGAIELEREATLVNNTFVDNWAPVGGEAVFNAATTGATLFGNIFAASVFYPTNGELGAPEGFFTDLGANISTFDVDAPYLTTSALIPGQVGASYESIGLSALADNGGPTQTMALTAPSIAIGAVTPAIYLAATGITKPTVDQRGVYRGNGTEASDSGAYELSTHIVPVDPAELAKTGANSGIDSGASIALASAALLSGAALVGGATLRNRRRRSLTTLRG